MSRSTTALLLRRCANSLIVTLALGALGDVRSADAHGDGTYPRTFNLDRRNTINAAVESRYDALVISWRVQNDQLDSLRSLNPSIKRLLGGSWYVFYNAGPSGYPAQWGPYDPADPVFGLDRKIWDLWEQNNWWLWARDSSGVKYHASMDYTSWDGNFTSKCPRNASGKRLCDVWADFLIANAIGQRHVEGMFFDYTMDGIGWMDWYQWGNCPYQMNCNDPASPKTPATKFKSGYDCDDDGIPEPPESTDVWWREGMKIIMSNLRARMGSNFCLIGNGHNHFSQMNGAMIENFPFILGSYDPAPNPYGYKWNSNMFSGQFGYLATYELIFAQPRFNLIDVTTPGGTTFEPDRTPERERFKRYTLASALMGNGYHGVHMSGGSSAWWEPEWDLQLGWPVGAATSVLSTEGVQIWRRKFTNGEAWVNPTATPVAASANNPALPAFDGVFQEGPGAGAPSGARLDPVSPNPVRAEGSFQFQLDAGVPATIQVYDIRGRLVKDLWTGTGTGAPQIAVWDGTSDLGYSTPAGIYFIALYSGGSKVQQRLVRLP